MRRQRRLPWWLLVAEVLVLELPQLVQALAQLGVQQVPEQVLEPEQQPVRVPQRWRHRSQRLRLRVSNWNRASIDRPSFSRHRRKRCASCQRFVRQQGLRVLP